MLVKAAPQFMLLMQRLQIRALECRGQNVTIAPQVELHLIPLSRVVDVSNAIDACAEKRVDQESGYWPIPHRRDESIRCRPEVGAGIRPNRVNLVGN